MSWVVIIAAVLFFGCTLLGFSRGFLKTVFSMLQMILTIVLVLAISPTVKDLLRNNTNLYDQARSGIVEAIESQIPEGSSVSAEMENALIEQIATGKILQEVLKDNNNSEVYASLGVTQFVDYLASYMAELIITALSFVLSFVVVLIVLQIVSLVFDVIGMLPVLGGVNRVAGGALGAAQGLVVLWLLCLLLTAFSDTKFGVETLQLINQNAILSLVYNNNLLLKIVIGLSMGL